MFAVLHWFLQAHKLDNEKKTHIPHQCSHQKKQVDYIKKTSARFWGHFWLRVEIGLKSGRLHQSFKNMRANKNRSLRVKIGLVFDFALSLALASWPTPPKCR